MASSHLLTGSQSLLTRGLEALVSDELIPVFGWGEEAGEPEQNPREHVPTERPPEDPGTEP